MFIHDKYSNMSDMLGMRNFVSKYSNNITTRANENRECIRQCIRSTVLSIAVGTSPESTILQDESRLANVTRSVYFCGRGTTGDNKLNRLVTGRRH